MHHYCWGPHCPHYHGYYPGWEASYPPVFAYPPHAPGYAQPQREDYVRRLESERDMLEQRLRRLEEQLAQVQQSAAKVDMNSRS